MTLSSMQKYRLPEWALRSPVPKMGRERSAPIVIWALASLLIGSIKLSDTGLYLSHPLLLLTSGLILLGRLGSRKPFGVPFGALFMITITILPLFPLLEGGSLNYRFLPEQMKMVFLIIGASTIAIYVTWRRLRALAIVMPPTLCIVLFFTLFSGAWDNYGVGHRYSVPAFGSPNSTAFVITVHLSMALYAASISKGNLTSKGYLILSLGVSAILLGFLAATSSDGGWVCGSLIILRFLGIRIRTLFYLLAVGVVAGIFAALYMPHFELPELFGSGRLYIWRHLIIDLFHSGILHVLFGMGPGAIDMRPSFTQSVVSAHSMYLEVLYSYGVVGLTTMVAAVAYLGVGLKRAKLSPTGRTFLETMFLVLVTGALFDTYLLTAQLAWLGALVIGFFGLTNRAAENAPVVRRAQGVGWL